MIRIYADGAALGNPGPGGYGVILKYGSHTRELSKGFRLTTNNRMELLGVITGLEAIRKPGIPVTIFSDSKYVVDAIEQGWLWDWEAKNFKKKANPDLWVRYIPIHHEYKPRFVWIKGHNGHPENERCDQLAVAAAEGLDFEIDEGYERSRSNS